MERIKYTCANCGWETSVVAQWKDLKPKRCMNKKCNTSFRASPDALKVKDPTLKPKKAETKTTVKKTVKKEETSGKTSSKQKTSSKVEQQQDEKTDS